MRPFVSQLLITALVLCLPASVLRAETPYKSNADFAKYAMKLRESALMQLEPTVLVPTQTRPLFATRSNIYPWKTVVMMLVFHG